MTKGLLFYIGIVAVVCFGAGCSHDPRYSSETQYLGQGGRSGTRHANIDTVSYWDGDGVSGSRIVAGSRR